MKKWWVGLLLMAVALVMIPATALALKHDGEIITHYCPNCKADRECRLRGDMVEEHVDENNHQFAFTCNTCEYEDFSGWESHYGGTPTCMEPAECAGCGASYTLAHTWSAATCETASHCSVCSAPNPDTSKNPNNHVGPMVAYDFVFSDDANHTERQQCRACKAIVSVGTEAHVPSRSATCAEPAFCDKCLHSYGEKDSTNHDWGEWTYKDANKHSHKCSRCYDEESASHSGGTATCNAKAKCTDCHSAYGAVDKSNHVGTLTDVDWFPIGDNNVHGVRQQCGACNGYVETETEAHVPGILANCTERAFCDKCKGYYGTTDPDNHNWGAWTYADANTHSRQCKRPDCAKVESASHSGGTATCVDKAECKDCHSAYGDVDANNHASTLDISYVYRNDYFHEVTEACQSCGYSNSINKGHTSATPATCATAAECTLCRTLYKNPANHTDSVTRYARISDEQHSVTVACDGCGTIFSSTSEDHDWGEWVTDGKTHTRTCRKPGCGAVDTGSHTSVQTATCVSAQTCAICDVEYLDPDNHEGDRVTTYAIDPDDAHQHIATQTCAGCQAVLSTGSEGHTKDEDANCMHATHCSVCDGYYGNTLSHRMGTWLPADDGQRHYRTCEYGCGETEYAAHDVTRTASCVAPASCRDCGVFGEVDADAHDWSDWAIWDTDQHWRYCRHNVSEHVEYADHTGGTATCEARAKCDVCDEYYGQRLGHDYVLHEGKDPTCTEAGWYDYATCTRCDYNSYAEIAALGHDLVLHNPKAATCTEGGWDVYETCSRCDYHVYVPTAALGHDIVTHKGRAATCTEGGWDAYESCARCDYTTYVEKSALGHWYGEWTPNADGTNSATCLRDAHEHTVDCARFEFALAAEDVRTAFVVCPVCGEVSGIRLLDENGEVVENFEDVRLELVEDAAAEALTERLPAGEPVLRLGALPGGEMLMSAAFEWGGEPTQPTGQVKITLPAALLEGYELRLVAEDGTETVLPTEVDAEAETVTFVLDFTDSEIPVQLIRLIPAA